MSSPAEPLHPALPGSTDPQRIAGLLPAGFTVGTATAAFQIEGAVDEDGRGRSTWDEFAERPGRILDGSTARVATDHYHRMDEDVALLAALGADAYRFSISWPRIQPEGSGPVNPAGLAFYDRLLDALLAAGIRPMATLFHWDTPSPLERRGGWLRRDTAERFAEFAAIAGRAYGDRVADWVTINEAATVVLDGYALGLHAPGRSRLFRAIPAAGQLLRAHGLAVQALRAVPVRGRIGITNVHSPVSAASDSAADRAMAGVLDFVHNRLFADPVLRGRRPEVPADAPPMLRLALRVLSRMSPRDLETIAQPLDFYGVNYYFPSRVAAGADVSGASSPDGETAAMRSVPFHLAPWPGHPVTGFGWPAVPEQLGVMLDQLQARYGRALPPVVITEGGASFPDPVGPDGRVDDAERVAYLAAHLAVAAEAASRMEVQGYYVWSLLDNWEWAAGFTQRFGLVHVDFDTLVRTPKRSFDWLREVQRRRSR
ncbi:GH1 family beta-glucosidase [Lysinimonas soli]|uniref:Beta-glucosidase n=1 Tax=Lysinimonas soli TaxID=1074233 RepID=A0ABW0NKP0_9MICO